MSEEIKIVITHKDNAASVGIQRTNTDPVFFKVAGSVLDAVSTLPSLLEQASRKWQLSARNPTTSVSAPTPPVTPRSNTQANTATPKVGAMDRMI